MTKTNIVLIGMPGAGKSTVGVALAEKTGRHFVDTDTLIEQQEKTRLQDIVDKQGHQALRRIEEQVLLDLGLRDHVIATGGSAVYSDQAMRHLKSDGVVVFLDVTLATLEKRIPDFSQRGLAKRPEQTIGELFDERHTLYDKYADVTIDCNALTEDEVCAAVMRATR